MDDARIVSVPEIGLRTVLSTLGPIIAGRERARLSYREHRCPGARFTAARTKSEAEVLHWWRETCRVVGLSPDLKDW